MESQFQAVTGTIAKILRQKGYPVQTVRGAAECRAAGIEPQYTGRGRYTRAREVHLAPTGITDPRSAPVVFGGADVWSAWVGPTPAECRAAAAAIRGRLAGADDMDARLMERLAEALESVDHDAVHRLIHRTCRYSGRLERIRPKWGEAVDIVSRL